MVKEIRLPDLGEGIEGADVSEVVVSVGDTVSKDDTLLVLESDKASMEIPAEEEGVIKEIPKGTMPDYHFHKKKTEYTILIKGKIICLEKNIHVSPGSIIKLFPYEKNDQFFSEESLILVLNTPSIQGDKYI